MGPDGDRRHGAQSGRIEDEKHVLVIPNHDIMRVLVLRNDLGDRAGRLLAPSPRQDITQRALLTQRWLYVGEHIRGDFALPRDGNDAHGSLLREILLKPNANVQLRGLQ